MKYKILWIDDEPANIETLRSMIEENFSKTDIYGRELVIEPQETFTEDLLTQLMEPGYNLIISDLNLLEGDNGDVLIRKIRQNNIFTDVLLYSNDPHLLIEKTEGVNYLEGIYRHAKLENLADKINNVIFQNSWREHYCLCRFQEDEEQSRKQN